MVSLEISVITTAVGFQFSLLFSMAINLRYGSVTVRITTTPPGAVTRNYRMVLLVVVDFICGCITTIFTLLSVHGLISVNPSFLAHLPQ